MRTLAPADHLDYLRSESRRFREVLTHCDPGARVPGCPAWTAADLLWHLTTVQLFWGTVVHTRPAAPSEPFPEPTRPESHDAMLAAFDDSSSTLLAELESADPGEPAWTWSADQTVGFTFRRQAHEALIHRVDAEQAAGQETPLDAVLAADGVLECLDVMYGGTPPWGTFHALPHYVRLDCTDTGHRCWVQIGRFVGTDPADDQHYDDNDIHVVADPGTEPDAVVAGPAGALDAWLWRRRDDEGITVRGARGIYDHFRDAVSHPIV